MSKQNFQVIQGKKIYSIDYLMKEELFDFDLNNLIDDNNLLYSIIIGMYKHIHSKRNLTDIIKNVQINNEWLSKNKWTEKERNDYENKLIKVLKNIYCMSDNIATQRAQWYMTIYGFEIK